MLKKRLIAALPILNGQVVQSIAFKHYLPVGAPEVCAEALNYWGADELMVLDMHASREGRVPDLALVKKVSNKIFMPLTYGGGITSVSQMVTLIHSGADKIAINSSALSHPELISEAAAVLGRQCVIVSMDVQQNSRGDYEVFTDSGLRPTGKSPVEWAREVEQRGAGEIHVNHIQRDGSKSGFDLLLLKEMLAAIAVPLIWMGGAGHPRHFFECLNAGADAVAAGNYFQFTEQSVAVTKAFLLRQGINVRLDTSATYDHVQFDESGRVAKLPDDQLQRLRFTFIEKEVI